MNKRLKFAAGLFLPYTLVRYLQRRVARDREQQFAAQIARERERQRATAKTYSYEAAFLQLVEWGLDPVELGAASIPLASLELCAKTLARYLAPTRPLMGLHIGNFVGVSACFFLHWITAQHPDALMLSVDPNITHRRIENPQQYVTRLVERFGLARQHLLLTGYTLEKNIGTFDSSEPDAMAGALERMPREAASENVLPNLARLSLKFDFVVIDGNHDAAYLARELDEIKRMLAAWAILILDDVSEHWNRIEKLYTMLLSEDAFVEVGRDARLGILLKAEP